MKYYLKLFGVFFLCLIIWNMALLIASIIGKTDLPTIETSIIASLIIILLTYFVINLSKKHLIEKNISPLLFSIYNTIFVLFITLLVTIPNNTTNLFFSNWFVYLTFISTAIGTYLGRQSFLKKKTV